MTEQINVANIASIGYFTGPKVRAFWPGPKVILAANVLLLLALFLRSVPKDGFRNKCIFSCSIGSNKCRFDCRLHVFGPKGPKVGPTCYSKLCLLSKSKEA